MKIKRGIFICFIGIDGSGKSTLAKKMRDLLFSHGINGRYLWGGHELLVLRPFVRATRKLITRKHDPFHNYAEYHSTLKKLGNRKALFFIYQMVILIEYLIEILIRIKIPLLIGRTIISDRYIFDFATNIASNYSIGSEKHKQMINGMLRVCPKPDILYFIDIPEETAMKRKDDIFSLEYLRVRRGYYKCIAENYDVIELDGLNSLELLSQTLQDNTKELLQKRGLYE